MVGFQTVDEAPLCSTPFCTYLDLKSNLNLSQIILEGKIYNLTLSSGLVLTQDEAVARGVSISHTIALNQTFVVQGIYNLGISHVITLVSNEAPTLDHIVAVSQPLYLIDDIKASYIYGMEFCDNIALLHKFGWVIDISMSNHFDITMEELDTIFNDLHLQHLLTTNMDDVDCLFPFGRTGDKDLSNNLIITQSLDANMIYACQTQQQLEILATLAWR